MRVLEDEQSPKLRIYAVVISNPTKSVAIWQQTASSATSEHDFLVVWDYHVILCLRLAGENAVWVYDVDSQLGSPCNWDSAS